MESGLKIRYLWHDVDVMELEVSASGEKFSAFARPYVSHDALKESAAILEGFPQVSSDVRELFFGNFGDEFAGGHVHLSFFCVNSSCHAVMEIRLVDKSGWHIGPGWSRPTQQAHFFLAIEAAAIDEFVKELRQVGRDLTGTAWLCGSSV